MSNRLNGKVIIAVLSVVLMNFGNVCEVQAKNKLNSLLNGDYAFSIWRVCVEAPAEGFDPNNLQLITEGKNVDFVDTGIFRFDGKGEVESVQTKIIQINLDQVRAGDFPIISGLESSCKGSYSVSSDMSYITEFTCNADLGNGLALTITPFRSEGQIGADIKTLTTSEIAGTIQTETISSGGQTLQTLERICTTSGTLVKVHKH